MPPMALLDGRAARDRAAAGRRRGRLRRADRRGRDDLHPALRGLHVRRELRRAERDLPRSRWHRTVLERLRDAAGGERGADRRSCALASPPSAHTVSVHVVEVDRRGHAWSRVRSVTPPIEALGPRRRHRLDRGAGRRRGPAAGPGRDRARAGRCRRSAASIPTSCSPSSRDAASSTSHVVEAACERVRDEVAR